MDDRLRERARKKFQNKRAFFIVTTVFGSISIILYIVSLNVDPYAAYWVRFPMLVLGLVLLIIYVSLFGFSMDSFREVEWEEEEIAKEALRLSESQEDSTVLRGTNEKPLDLEALDKLEKKNRIE